MNRQGQGLLILLGAVALLLQACPSAGVYRTAKTLEPGTSDFGLSFNVTKISSESISATDDTGEEATADTSDSPDFTIPKIIPELSFHVGIEKDIELGGRVDISAGLLELDGKYRFLESDGLHLAVQPAIGYQSLFILEGYRATLPLLVTYEINDWFALNVHGLVQYSDISPTDDTADGAVDISGVAYGGGGGFIFSGETFFFSPGIEITKTALSADSSDSAGSATFNYTYTIISLNMGWILGQEKKSLDRIENKLDKVLAE